MFDGWSGSNEKWKKSGLWSVTLACSCIHHEQPVFIRKFGLLDWKTFLFFCSSLDSAILPSQASAIHEPWTSRCSSWFYKRQRNQRSNCQHPLDHQKSKRVPEKHLFLLYWLCQSLTLATSCEELTHWKSPWCWEGLGAGGEGDDRGWDGWMASLTRCTWVWVNSGSWWWTGRPGVLRFMGSQRVGRDWAMNWTELNWTEVLLVGWSL